MQQPGTAPGPGTDGRPAEPSSSAKSDPRLDTSAWRVFGRRFPRRWSLYFRLVAVAVLALSLTWWFTRDVTYVGNVKVSGLDAAAPEYRKALRSLAEDFKGVATRLADEGYGWQAGGLPALRAADALTKEEAVRFVALGTLEIKAGSTSLTAGKLGEQVAASLRSRGWTSDGGSAASVAGMAKDEGPLHASFEVSERPEGRQRLTLEITVKNAG